MLIVTEAWRDDTGAVVKSFIEDHVVMVIVAIIQVRVTMVSIRATPSVRIQMLEMTSGECK